MFLYRSQPKNKTDINIINLETKRVVTRRILETQKKFNDRGLTRDDIIAVMSDASILDAMITLMGYQNILVVTSFDKTNYPDRMREPNMRPIKSAGDHMLPIVHKVNESAGRMFVTKPRSADNYYTRLYDEFDIAQVEVDDNFMLDTNFKIHDRIVGNKLKFDAVVLLGSESMKRGKFNMKTIGHKFEKYANITNTSIARMATYDLIDVYRNDLRKLSGNRLNIDDVTDRLVDIINTPKKVYDSDPSWISEDFIDDGNTIVRTKHRLMYRRLGENIRNMNDYFRVYRWPDFRGRI